MTHRVLLCTLGGSPAVATETVWALRKRDPPWVPDEIVIVTTTFALKAIRESLQSPTGPLAELMGGPPPVSIHAPCRGGGALVWRDFGAEPVRERLPGWTEDGELLADVDTGEDALLMGNLIFRRVVEVVKRRDSELHLSLAGGRKTMSAHALMALTLVGRAVRDEASHVLVSAPFEGNPRFWHPDQSGGSIPVFGGGTADPATARVALVVTETPLMRRRVKDVSLLENLDLAAAARLVNLARRLEVDPLIGFDSACNTVTVGGVERRLGYKQFPFFRLLATAYREIWPGVGPEGEGPDFAGWLTTRHIVTGTAPDGEAIAVKMERFIGEAMDADGRERHSDPLGSEEETAFEKWHEGVVVTQNHIDAGEDVEEKIDHAEDTLGPNRTNLGATLVETFGPDAAAMIAPESTRTRPPRYGMSRHFPTQAIQIG